MNKQKTEIFNKLLEALANDKVESIEIIYNDPRRLQSKKPCTLDEDSTNAVVKNACSKLKPQDDISINFVDGTFAFQYAKELLEMQTLYATPNGETFYQTI